MASFPDNLRLPFWGLNEIRQPPTSLCTTSNFIIWLPTSNFMVATVMVVMLVVVNMVVMGSGQDKTKLSLKLDFPGNLWLAVFAISVMFFKLSQYFFSWTPCNCSLEKWKATIGQGRGLVKWLSSCWTSKVWQRAADHPSNHCRLNHALEQPFQVPSFENSLTQQTFFKQLSFANDQWRPKGLQEAV